MSGKIFDVVLKVLGVYELAASIEKEEQRLQFNLENSARPSGFVREDDIVS